MNFTYNLQSQSDHAGTAPKPDISAPHISPPPPFLYDQAWFNRFSDALATAGIAMVNNADLLIMQQSIDFLYAQNEEIMKSLKRLEARNGVERISQDLGGISLKLGRGGNGDGAESGTASLKRGFAEVSNDRLPGGSGHKRRKNAGDDIQTQ
jgi:hypothetical protein